MNQVTKVLFNGKFINLRWQEAIPIVWISEVISIYVYIISMVLDELPSKIIPSSNPDSLHFCYYMLKKSFSWSLLKNLKANPILSKKLISLS